MELMRPAAHRPQPITRLVQRPGLGHQPPVEGQGLVRPQHPGVRVVARHGQGLGLGQTDGQGGGIQVAGYGLDRVLVHPGDTHVERHPGVFQHGPPRRALGGQDQGLRGVAHQVVPILWLRCSLSRLVMAAAVSSTDLRLTSIVGQPRRSKARRALIVSSRTAS